MEGRLTNNVAKRAVCLIVSLHCLWQKSSQLRKAISLNYKVKKKIEQQKLLLSIAVILNNKVMLDGQICCIIHYLVHTW